MERKLLSESSEADYKTEGVLLLKGVYLLGTVEHGILVSLAFGEGFLW